MVSSRHCCLVFEATVELASYWPASIAVGALFILPFCCSGGCIGTWSAARPVLLVETEGCSGWPTGTRRGGGARVTSGFPGRKVVTLEELRVRDEVGDVDELVRG